MPFTLDGNGKTISNLTISGNYNQGLFGYTYGATIKNVKLTNVDVTGKDNVGAVVGLADNKTQISNCSAQGNIKGSENVGGLVGVNNGTIKAGAYLGGTLTGNYYCGTLADGVDGNGAQQIFNVTLPKGVTSSALVKIHGTTYIKGGEVIFNYNGDSYNYNVTNDFAVTLQDNKLYIGGDPIFRRYATFTIKDSLKNYIVTVKNEDAASKVNWHYGSASLNSGSDLKYQLLNEKNVVALTSNTYGDKITFSENAALTYGEIEVDLLAGNVISTNGADTITVTADDLSFEGYGVQFVDLEVGMDSRELTPIKATYNSADKSYTVTKSAQVKTLSDDFTKLALESSGGNNEKYARYKIFGCKRRGQPQCRGDEGQHIQNSRQRG